MGLDSVELVMDVEEKFGIEISEAEASKMRTVGQFYDVVLSKLDAGKQNMDKQQAWELLKSCIVRIGGVKPERVVPEAQIVKDLGIN